jgi:hypothetical protein
VLTARHCIVGRISVRVGSVNRTSGGVTRSAASPPATRNDLALIRLSSPVAASYMPLAGADPPVNSTNVVYGWGMTCKEGCDFAPVLKTASVLVTSTGVVDAARGPAIESIEINGHAWNGDSGGPQVYNGAQVGVASTADGVSRQRYASVALNRSWIRSVAGV